MSMDWSNERFVRFFTRDTVTWKRWSWEAKAVWGLVLRKVDRAGVIDTGRTEKTDALALILEVPCEVAVRVVSEWLQSGALVESEGGYCVPNFIAAQETPMSDRQRQEESRGKKRAANLRSSEDACHALSRAVTPSHAVSRPVTPDQTRPDQTRPIVPPPKKPASVKVEKPTDPRHAPLTKRLGDTFAAVKGFAYPFQGRDFKAVSNLLARAEPDAIDAAWGRALREATHPPIACIYELEPKLAHFMGPSPPTRGVARPVHVSNQSSTVVSEGL